VAAQTLERAAEIGVEVHVLPPWYDVDDIASLRMLRSELREGHAFSAGLTPHRAVNSTLLLDTLMEDADLARRLDGAVDPTTQRAAE
jgi:hypothetical protein